MVWKDYTAVLSRVNELVYFYMLETFKFRRESIITTSEELVFGISTFGISNHHDGLATKDQTSKLKTDIFSKSKSKWRMTFRQLSFT